MKLIKLEHEPEIHKSTPQHWCTHKCEQEMRTGYLNMLLKATLPKFINSYVMLCSTAGEENLSSSVPTHLLTLILNQAPP